MKNLIIGLALVGFGSQLWAQDYQGSYYPTTIEEARKQRDDWKKKDGDDDGKEYRFGLFNFTAIQEDRQYGKLVEKFKQSPINLSMDFSKFSLDATKIYVDITLKHSAFEQIFVHNRDLKVRYTLSNPVCDKLTLSNVSDNQNLQDVIASFRKIDYNNFMECDFTLTYVSHNNSFQLQNANYFRAVDTSYHYSAYTGFYNSISMSLFDDETASLEMTRLNLALTKNNKTMNPGLRSEALQSAQRFISLLKQHGEVIIEASKLDMGSELRETMIVDSLRTKRAQIEASLQSYQANYKFLSFIDKLSLTYSINSTYKLLQKLELNLGRISRQDQRLDLDRVIFQ